MGANTGEITKDLSKMVASAISLMIQIELTLVTLIGGKPRFSQWINLSGRGKKLGLLKPTQSNSRQQIQVS